MIALAIITLYFKKWVLTMSGRNSNMNRMEGSKVGCNLIRFVISAIVIISCFCYQV